MPGILDADDGGRGRKTCDQESRGESMSLASDDLPPSGEFPSKAPHLSK